MKKIKDAFVNNLDNLSLNNLATLGFMSIVQIR